MGAIEHWAYHYLWLDVYVPVWPNIAASAILGVWAFRKFLHLEKLHHKREETAKKRHEELLDAVRNSGTRGNG